MRLAIENDVLNIEREAAILNERARDRIETNEKHAAQQSMQEGLHESRRHAAAQKLATTRAAKAASVAQAEESRLQLAAEATREIERKAAEARMDLEVRRQQRETAKMQSLQQEAATLHSDDMARQRNVDAGVAAVADAKVFKHRTAEALAVASTRAQATVTTTQGKVALTRAHATAKAAAISRAAYEVQKQCDSTIAARMRDSAMELESAHERCKSIRDDVAAEAASYKGKMLDLERRASADAREAQRKIQELDTRRVELFCEGQQKVKEALKALEIERSDCDAAILDVHRRLQEIEEETKARANAVLAQWTWGSQEVDEKVRMLEEEGVAAITELETETVNLVNKCKEEHGGLQERGTAAVQALERQAENIMVATLPKVKQARQAEDQAAAEARSELDRLKPVLGNMQAAADEEIAAGEAKAAAEIERSNDEAETAVARARQATHAAQEEQKILQAKTFDAGARLRAAYYQLRLLNLHDLARDIADGAYDLQSPEGA
jgi:hypothetical protein